MYYIYHIPEIKIGVSMDPTKRVQNQGYNSFEILEEHEDINIVSKREKELQRQYGYRVDGPDYSATVERSITAAKSTSVAKVNAARENVKKATIAAVLAGAPGKAGKANAEKHRECPHCGKQGKGPTMFRYHFNNCKLNPDTLKTYG
jgi:hypothetical protein